MIPRAAAAGPRARAALVPAAVAFLLGLPALGGGWVWDDPLIVKVQLGAFRTVGSLFFPPVGIPGFSVHYYRPLTTATFLLDRALYGERAWGFHLTPLLLHAAAAGLLYLLLDRLLAGRAAARSAALAGALLFAALPVHAESVAWIAGRADPLAAVCLLAAALWLLRRPLGPGALVAGTVCFVGGVPCEGGRLRARPPAAGPRHRARRRRARARRARDLALDRDRRPGGSGAGGPGPARRGPRRSGRRRGARAPAARRP